MDFETDYYYDELERDWDEAYEPDEAQEWESFDPDC
jgi:hypothetical protein